MGDHVFVCYSRKDEDFVLSLAANLKSRGVTIWLDQWDIPSGADWDLTIDDALYDCSHFIIILSPNSIKSREVRSELRTAFDENKHMIPILYQSCRVPRPLRLIQYIDYTSCSADDIAALNDVLVALGKAERTFSISSEILAPKETLPAPSSRTFNPKDAKSCNEKGSDHQARWSVIENESKLKIAFGNSTANPLYATLHLENSYFRLVNSPHSSWGTSVILLPSFWAKGTCYQGAPMEATWKVSGPVLMLSMIGTIGGLNVSSEVRITPPANNRMSAHVKNTIRNSILLDSRPGEAFIPIMLSSMRISSSIWDAQSAFAGGQNYSIPINGWIISPRSEVRTNDFGLLGGSSGWKQNAPTITINLDRSMQIAGLVVQSSNPNADNVGFWAASENILLSYQYTVTAISP